VCRLKRLGHKGCAAVPGWGEIDMPKQFDRDKAAKILALALGSSSAGERAAARVALSRMLDAHGIAGRDLLRYYLDRCDEATLAQVNDLLHPLWTTDDDDQREQRRMLVERRLIRWRLSWPDLIFRIRTGSSNGSAWHWLLDDTGTALVVTEEVSVSVLDLISHLISQYVALDPDQLVVATLWTAHTHITTLFMCSPRLAICGPMQNVGKTTLMDVLNRLVLHPWRAASASEASLYGDTDGDRITQLIDEMHYADLRGRRAAILHAGYRQGTPIRLAKKKKNTFCAAAFGFIGSCLTPELQSRSLLIQLRRHDGSYPLRRFDLADTVDLDTAYQQVCDWAANVQLDRDPQMPSELLRDSRWADNARPLVAIADAAGERWGKATRESLTRIIVLHQSEHPNSILIGHLHEVFAVRGYPKAIWSDDIVAALRASEDWPWREYRGPEGRNQPRPLRQTDLAAMLHQFDARIRPRSVRIGKRTQKGYLLEQLDPQFRAYCDHYQPGKMETAQ
jgi:hypothetical protein